jgi:hypothetical protein
MIPVIRPKAYYLEKLWNSIINQSNIIEWDWKKKLNHTKVIKTENKYQNWNTT